MRVNRILAAGLIGLASMAFGVKSAKATVFAYDNFSDSSETAPDPAAFGGWQYDGTTYLNSWQYSGSTSGGVFNVNSGGGYTERYLATPTTGNTIWYAVTMAAPTIPLPGTAYVNNTYETVNAANSVSDVQPQSFGFDNYEGAYTTAGWPYAAGGVTVTSGQSVTLLSEINLSTGEVLGWGTTGPVTNLNPNALGTPIVDIPGSSTTYASIGLAGEGIDELYISSNSGFDITYVALADNAAQAINPVPEPGSLSILGIGSLALLRRRRRQA